MTSSHSLWRATTETPSFPSLQGNLLVDVAIIGGGITGLTAAALLKMAGRSVAVLTSGRIGSGATGHTTAHLTVALDDPYQTLITRFSEQGARVAVQASSSAISRIEVLCREMGVDCGFQRLSGYRYSETTEDIEYLEKETQAGRSLGLDLTVTRQVPLPFPVSAAIHFPHQAQFHPMRYLAGLAHAVHGSGSHVFENTLVQEYHDGEPCRVHAGKSIVSARHVILATHTPPGIVATLQTRLSPYLSYAMAVRLRQPVPVGLFWDTGDPYYYTRPYPDDPTLAIIGGQDHKTGHESDTFARYAALEQYIRQRWPVERVEHHWSSQVFEPADGLPYIGLLPTSQHLYVATGFSGTGMTFGTAAAMHMTDLILGKENPWADVFTPSRLKPVASARGFAQENISVAWRFIADRLRGAPDDQLPAPGQGRIIELEGHKAAAYRAPDGRMHVMSPVCQHMGCIVHWNAAEKTWDCPCHGARYEATGGHKEGPAPQGLKQEEKLFVPHGPAGSAPQ